MSSRNSLGIACGVLFALAILVIAVLPVQAEAPANDNFADAIVISGTHFEADLYNNEATVEPNEPIPDCWFGPAYPTDENYHTIWLTITPESNGHIQGYIDGYFILGLGVYTGQDLANLNQTSCRVYVWDYEFDVQAGETYYLQIGGMYEQAGWIHFSLDYIPTPPNDNFVNASPISLGDSIPSNNAAASLEPGEPIPSCVAPEYYGRTLWFLFTPTTGGAVTADTGVYWSFIAAYTGSELGNLTETGCRSESYQLSIDVEADTTYYFQVGSQYSWEGGELNFQLYETPPPTADFEWGLGDPNIFDTIEFCDASSDPKYFWFTEFWWDFGDGITTTGNCAYHRYAADGDYTVWHNAQTSDGRSDPDGVTHIVSVRTHDVAAVRVAAPKAASAGQTRTITVSMKNNSYPELVDIQLYKTVPGGFEWVNSITQTIPVRSGNRTTPVAFFYTFTQGDADIGKVSFKAVVNLMEARDALPADNEAISPPTKVQ